MRTMLAPVLLLVLGGVAPAAGQNPDTLLPEESAKKAKELIQSAIGALGGPAYLHERERACEGRFYQFDHNGQLYGQELLRIYWRFPDKNRTEYSKKGNIVDVFAGDAGWTLDRGGVSEEPASAVSEFQERVKRNLDNLLRLRLQEPGMIFRYAGSDTVDLKAVDWVEIVDREGRTFRIAVDHSKHLPVRYIVITNNEADRERNEEVTLFSNYQAIDGVQLPKQVARTRDGRRIYQVFFDDCKLNSGLPDELFTRASLDKHYGESGGKNKKK